MFGIKNSSNLDPAVNTALMFLVYFTAGYIVIYILINIKDLTKSWIFTLGHFLACLKATQFQ